MPEKIISSEYSDVMQKSYIDYAMSVICARAVPDVRDGSAKSPLRDESVGTSLRQTAQEIRPYRRRRHG